MSIFAVPKTGKNVQNRRKCCYWCSKYVIVCLWQNYVKNLKY